MPDCRDLESLLAPYVDDEAPPDERAAVEAHLQSCPPCRDRVTGERVARDILRARREELRGCASGYLRRRCAAHASRPASAGLAPRAPQRRSWIPLSVAATLLLAVAGVFIFGLNSVDALAAELALDHMKCFRFAPEHAAAAVTGDDAAREWTKAQGWSLKVPSTAPQEQLELLGVRRCLSTEGLTAHLMYRWRGAPLSVYVINHALRRAGSVVQSVDKLGQQTILWSDGGRTYAVVGRRTSGDLGQVAQYMRQRAE